MAEKFDYGLPVYIIMEKFLCPLEDLSAFKVGLINENFEVIKDPENISEESHLTPLDRLIFKIRSVAEEQIQEMSALNLLKNVLVESNTPNMKNLSEIKQRAENKIKMDSQFERIQEELKTRSIDKDEFFNYIIENQVHYNG